MKLLLTSEGLVTQEIIDEVIRLVGKPQIEIRFAVLNHGHAVEEGDKQWVINDLINLRNAFPAYIDLIDLYALTDDQVLERLALQDAILVIGGNTEFLMHVCSTTMGDALKRAADHLVWVGISAGSMIAGRRIGLDAYRELFGDPGDYAIDRYYGWVPFAIQPHLGSTDFPRNTVDNLARMLAGDSGTLYALNDEQAVSFADGEVKFIGGTPVTFVNGVLQG
jgi:dipeptidase E